jgi:hypothetical protein
MDQIGITRVTQDAFQAARSAEGIHAMILEKFLRNGCGGELSGRLSMPTDQTTDRIMNRGFLVKER